MLEKTLEDVKRGEEQERDSYTLMRLSQRRQVVEQKLIAVRQQLAESSKVVTGSECITALHFCCFAPITVNVVGILLSWHVYDWLLLLWDCFIQYFDIRWLDDRKDICPLEIQHHLSPKILLQKKVVLQTEAAWLAQVKLENTQVLLWHSKYKGGLLMI